MKLVTKKAPRGRLFRELSAEETRAVGNVCGLGQVHSLTEKQMAETVLRSMRDQDLWLACDCKTTSIGIGAGLTARLLPHHRTYGSVYGGSIMLTVIYLHNW